MGMVTHYETIMPIFPNVQEQTMRTLVTDQDIQALIDGQLNDDDAELVMLYISDKSWAQDRYFELQAQKESIINFFMHH